MKYQRKELLHRLLCVAPGVAKREVLQQSSCVVLRRGRFYTLSQEVACSLASGLPPEMEGAVHAAKLLDLLQQLPDELLELSATDHHLIVRGRRRRATLALEQDIVLPVEEVDRPAAWRKLSPDYAEAIALVKRCTRKRDEFTKECVHVHPDYLEASDNTRMIRYRIKSLVAQPVLVRGETLGVLVQLGMTKGSETDSWLHFRNPLGLRVSLRKFALEQYPDLSAFLDLRGRRIVFPKGLANAALLAGLFADPDGGVRLTAGTDGLVIRARDQEGEYEEGLKMHYMGPEMTFSVPPQLLVELIEQHTHCEVSECSLRVNGGKFIYVTSLEMRA